MSGSLPERGSSAVAIRTEPLNPRERVVVSWPRFLLLRESNLWSILTRWSDARSLILTMEHAVNARQDRSA